MRSHPRDITGWTFTVGAWMWNIVKPWDYPALVWRLVRARGIGWHVDYPCPWVRRLYDIHVDDIVPTFTLLIVRGRKYTDAQRRFLGA